MNIHSSIDTHSIVVEAYNSIDSIDRIHSIERDKEKQMGFTFFNEEWNQPFWEDNVDVLDSRNRTTSEAVED
jgi:hypothetical protein